MKSPFDQGRSGSERPLGLQVSDVNAVVQAAVGGQAVTQVYEGERLFDLVIRFLPVYRQDMEAMISVRLGSAYAKRS